MLSGDHGWSHRSNGHNSVTWPFAVQIGKQCGLAMKKLVEKGEEIDYDEPSYPKMKKEGDGHEEAVQLNGKLI